MFDYKFIPPSDKSAKRFLSIFQKKIGPFYIETSVIALINLKQYLGLHVMDIRTYIAL